VAALARQLRNGHFVWIRCPLFADELNGLFRTSNNTQSTSLTSIGIGRVRSLPFMSTALELRKKTELRKVFIRHAANFEYVVRAYFDTITFTFAFGTIDDRVVLARFGTAFFPQSIGMFCRTTRFFLIEAFGFHRAGAYIMTMLDGREKV